MTQPPIAIEARPPRRTEPLSPETAPPTIGAKPSWIKVPLSHGPHFKGLKRLVREQGLNTICEEAACPNIGECWGEFRTASFLLLGDTCTRNCGFCDVTTGRPGAVDWAEPLRLAEAVARLELRHVVITSVTRDDLRDGGAAIFAMTIRAAQAARPGSRRRSPDPGLSGQLGRAGDGDARRPGHPEPQPRDRAAPVLPRAAEGHLYPVARAAQTRAVRCRRARRPSLASCSALARRTTSCCASSTTCAHTTLTSHARPVSAPESAPPARRAIRYAR